MKSKPITYNGIDFRSKLEGRWYNFFHNYLSRKHWKVPYQRTSQMLKDNLNCTTKRVGKHKLSVFVVSRFDKKPETYTPKPFKKDNY